jgi:hypothetical protein
VQQVWLAGRDDAIAAMHVVCEALLGIRDDMEARLNAVIDIGRQPPKIVAPSVPAVAAASNSHNYALDRLENDRALSRSIRRTGNAQANSCVYRRARCSRQDKRCAREDQPP